MKSLYESILDTDVLDKADEGANRLLDVIDMLHTLVDDLDIKRDPNQDAPDKIHYPARLRLYFVFNHGMPKDSYNGIRSRLEKFKKDVKKLSGIEISVNTTSKRAAINILSQRRKNDWATAYDITHLYTLGVSIDKKSIGTINISVSQYSTGSEPHLCSISSFLGDFDDIVFPELLKQMDKNK